MSKGKSRRPHPQGQSGRPNKRQEKPEKKGGGGIYWMYGVHACESALNNPLRTVRRILISRPQAEYPFLRSNSVQPEMVEADRLQRLVPEGAVHQGIVCEVEPLDEPLLTQLAADKAPIAVLDQVTDPHNVGAILRSAAAFNIAAVILPKDHAPAEGGVLARSASGALDLVPCLRVTNLASTLSELKDLGYWIAGLDGDGTKSIEAAREFHPVCLVLGAEGKGLRRLTRERCDVILSIPISKRMESLNVSNAAAIAFFSAHKPQ